LSERIDIVVLNCYNDGYIQPCIESIGKNTTGYNLIVVEQDSKDGTREWLRDCPYVSHLILNKKNMGVAGGRNQGIRVGRHEWIAFIDSDIVIKDSNWLDKVWNFTIDRRVGLIECAVDIDGGKHFGKLSFCLLRRQCLNEVGYFDARFIIGEDDEWLTRFEDTEWKVMYCSDTDIKHHGGRTVCVKLASAAALLVCEAEKMLCEKYTANFRLRTLLANKLRRVEKEVEHFKRCSPMVSVEDLMRVEVCHGG